MPINTTAYEALRGTQEGSVSNYVFEWAGKNVASPTRIASLNDAPRTIHHTAAGWMSENGPLLTLGFNVKFYIQLTKLTFS